MTNNKTTIIPVLIAIVLIPQLLFWWLVPESADALYAVYSGGTILTIALPVAAFAVYWQSDLRRSAGVIIVAAVLDILVMAISAVLLGLDSSVRSAVFAFLITTMVCLIFLIPLIGSALRVPRQGVYPMPVPIASYDVTPPDRPDHEGCASMESASDPQPSRAHRRPSGRTPLPPRNR